MKFFADGLRLGAINLQVELDTPTNEFTSLSTSSGDSRAVLHHHDTSLAILLPSPASKTDIITFPLGRTIIASRISSYPSRPAVEPAPLLPADDINWRWSRGLKFTCFMCYRTIVPNRPLRWKDLPRDSWLECSDYWLCRRGDSHDHDRAHSHHRHTSASLGLPTPEATPDIVLVGLTFLLISPDITQNITTKVLPPPFPPTPFHSLPLRSYRKHLPAQVRQALIQKVQDQK